MIKDTMFILLAPYINATNKSSSVTINHLMSHEFGMVINSSLNHLVSHEFGMVISPSENVSLLLGGLFI